MGGDVMEVRQEWIAYAVKMMIILGAQREMNAKTMFVSYLAIAIVIVQTFIHNVQVVQSWRTLVL